MALVDRNRTFRWWGRWLMVMAVAILTVMMLSSAAPTYNATNANSYTEAMNPLSKLNEGFDISEASAKEKKKKESACPMGEFRARYYANSQTPGGSPTSERCENDIDNDWGLEGSPDSGVGVDNFSARWKGKHDFEAGEYTFTATADDGVRVWVDGEPVIDEWRNQAATTYEATRTLTAGKHGVKVEYYEASGSAAVQVDWTKVSDPAPNPAPASIEAETMDWPSELGKVFSEGTASGGSALFFFKSGTANKEFAGSTDRITVRAKGDQCNGAPRMVAKINGVERLSQSVSAESWTDYAADVDLGDGQHTLEIAFTNDHYEGPSGCDRNLYIDVVSLGAPVPDPDPDPGSIALGAFISGGAPGNGSVIDGFNDMVGTDAKIVMSFQAWEPNGFGSERFHVAGMDNIASRGATPMVTWEPWKAGAGTSQSKYTLDKIAGGDHDAYIRQWARDAKAWDKLLYLRFAHEMNGDWYPWSPNVNGNTSADYVAAWRHVHDIFEQEGATNVRWVWAPNHVGGPSFQSVYPGDTYVDWVGIDGYNWGTTQSWSRWQRFTEVFGPAYDELASMTDKPMMIAETASAEQGGNKADWIRRALTEELPQRFPKIKAVVWFHMNKEADWRVNSSSASLTAYKAAAASSSLQGQLP